MEVNKERVETELPRLISKTDASKLETALMSDADWVSLPRHLPILHQTTVRKLNRETPYG